jgi:hypothetical protein
MLPRLLSAARHPETVRRMRVGYAALNRLPYRELWCIDADDQPQPASRLVPLRH